MSADDSFLARWSRRKRTEAARGQPPRKIAIDDPPAAAAAPSPAPPQPEATIDLTGLPSINSIGAGADIRAFLTPGVPADLARAALRRAWSADPAIRDFIGLSENSWDFTAPAGVPGFGSVTPEQVAQLLVQLSGEPNAAETAVSGAERASAAAARGAQPPPEGSAQQGAGNDQETSPSPLAPQHDLPKNISPQHELAMRESLPVSHRRKHGRALPE